MIRKQVNNEDFSLIYILNTCYIESKDLHRKGINQVRMQKKSYLFFYLIL